MSNAGTWLRYHYFRGGFKGVSETILRHLSHSVLYHYNQRCLTDSSSVPRSVTIDPDTVAVSTISKHRFPHKGPDAFLGELGGVWDRFRSDAENTVVYRSLYDRFEEGYRWEDTELYRLERWKIEHIHDSKTEAYLEERCRSIDRLYEDIEANGYEAVDVAIRRIEQAERVDRAENAIRVGDFLVPDEPRIGIGRDGTSIRLGGGRHRIAIAKLLGIGEIPAVVLVQHPDHERSE